MRQNTAVVIFSRTPQIARRNPEEPFASLPWDDLDALFTALLVDTIQNVCQLGDADVLLYRNEREFADEFLAPFKTRVRCCDLLERSFTEEVQQAIESAFAEHYHRVLVLLENNPVGIPQRLRRMLDQLGQEDDCVVLAPTADGRCASIAMKANHSWIFDDDGGDPLAKPHLLLQRLCTLQTLILPQPVTHLLDSGANIARLRDELEGVEDRNGEFPRRTYEMFKVFEKKYKTRKASR